MANDTQPMITMLGVPADDRAAPMMTYARVSKHATQNRTHARIDEQSLITEPPEARHNGLSGPIPEACSQSAMTDVMNAPAKSEFRTSSKIPEMSAFVGIIPFSSKCFNNIVV